MELKEIKSAIDRPVLTVVKSTNLLPVKSEKHELTNGKRVEMNGKPLMPDMTHGYIKCKKHDCL